jgi:hypothetical protein
MINQLIWLLIYAVCIGLLAWLAYYVIDAIPVPDPIGRFAKIVVVVVAVIALILLLLKIPPAAAQRPAHQPYYTCEGHIPYYAEGDYGPGQALMAIFLPMMVAVAVPAASADPTALCTPLAVAGSRPPRATPARRGD